MTDSRSLRRTPSQETLMSLLQLDPTPMPDTEKDLPPLPEEPSEKARSIRPGHARTTSLGLSGSGQGSTYYRTPYSILTYETIIAYPSDVRKTNISSSYSHTTILDLRPFHIHRPPFNQHLVDTPNYPRGPLLRVVPPPRPRDLSDTYDRALVRRPPSFRTHRIRDRITFRPALAQPEEIWRCYPGRLSTEVIHRVFFVIRRGLEAWLATTDVDIAVRVWVCPVSWCARFHEPPFTVTRRGRQRKY